MLRVPCASLSNFSKCFRAFLITSTESVINTATYYQKLPDVDHDGFTRNLTVGDDDHDVGVGGEHVDKCGEIRVADLREKDKVN